jgi:exopolyphosphatase/guanosine-5'-triphosphate,3'-diphosphate pyrophosphatase
MSRTAAAIDIGTNSVKLLIAREEPGGFAVISDRSSVVKPGEGVGKYGIVTAAAIERSAEALSSMVREARAAGAEAIRAVATHALREASNSDEFAARIKSACGISVEIIPESEEARLSYIAAGLSAGESGAVMAFDVGGGSSEMIYGRGKNPDRWMGAPLGALTLHERTTALSDPPGAELASRAAKGAAEIIASSDLARAYEAAQGEPFKMIGIGGTVSCLAWTKLGLPKEARGSADGAVLRRSEIEDMAVRMCGLTLEERKRVPGLPEDRADVAPAGALIVAALMKAARKEEFTVGLRGLRHGIMADLLSG